MTLEEAQARIIELEEEAENLRNENATLSQNNSDLSEDVEKLRTINQNYFNRLIAQNKKEDPVEPEEEILSCEDFALKLVKGEI